MLGSYVYVIFVNILCMSYMYIEDDSTGDEYDGVAEEALERVCASLGGMSCIYIVPRT